MVIIGEHTCLSPGEENDEQIVSMASHSLLHNGNIIAAGNVGRNSPMAQLAATPERHSHINDHPRGVSKSEDDDLTSLSWLQDTNLLRNIQVGVHEEETEEYADDVSHSPFSDDCQDEEEGMQSDVPHPGDKDAPTQPYAHVDYNPHVHISSKPPYSFSCLIFMAIEDTPIKALPVKEIYAWIVRHFPYYQNAPTGWKNSVRHNLSLNKCFRKVEKDKGQNVGKGSLWCIDPEFRPNLLQTLKKAPQCPFSQLDDVPLGTSTPSKSSAAIKNENPNVDMDSRDSSAGAGLSQANVPSPDLFPYLARRLSVSAVKSSEVDAAATMLTLKNGSSCQSSISKTSSEEENTQKTKLKVKRKKKNNRFRNNPGYHQENPGIANASVQAMPVQQHKSRMKGSSPGDSSAPASGRGCVPGPVITSSPSEDHTYSASPSQPSSSDHNSCSGSPVPMPEEQQPKEEVKTRTSKEEEERMIAEEEERCLEEGAQALLSLAKNSLWSDPKRTLVLLQTTPTSER